MKGNFTHLHLHSSYSLLDGAIRISDLMEHCSQLGMDSVALTDHGNMFGAIEFYKAARPHKIKPIIGNEFYVAPGSRKETRQLERLVDGNNFHLVLLAINQIGYSNLIHLTSRSYTEGFYRKPRIDHDLLAAHSEGLVCLSACLAGEIQRRGVQGEVDKASALACKFKEIFGPDRFYLEIQRHGIPEEEEAARVNLEIARRNNIPLVLTNDSHFLRREDQEAQDILLRINSKKSLEEDLAFSFNPEFYVKSPQEMARLYPDIPEAFHNTRRIAEMVDLSFEFGNPLLPHFDVPSGHTLDSYLRELALEGLEKHYREITPQIRERFEFEYNTITGMDFSGYFLIVHDFINWARRSNIPVGPGRGSAAGSLISYCLGITDIDPLKYDLLFERFLNPDRKEMPDIDIDFCTDRREEVIHYAREKYGMDRVGQIITFGTMAARACIKDVARILNIPFDEANQISKKFPDVLNISIDQALETSRELRQYAESGEVQKRLFSVARRLEGNARQTGVHAAGVVIAPAPLEQLVPLATVAPRAGSSSAERVFVTQYDKGALEDVGLVKMDFLGLRNLTVLHKATESIRSRLNRTIDINSLPLDDEKTYQLLHRGDVKGVFQLESSPGMREFVLRMKPHRFEEIIALIALFRPGPLKSGMADSYINRKNGREKVEYAHPDLEEILKDTFGVVVYQEQVMLISRKIGGFTPGESDALRKAMGKKIKDKMARMQVKFVEGATQRGHARSFAEELYEQMAQFAEYGFNKSHSAAYAMIVYQTAYMKANYPTDYMCAVLDSEIEKTEKLVPYINACKEMDIQILGPDINESSSHFRCVEEGVIRFGLSGIKNVGGHAIEEVIEKRESLPQKKFKSFFELMENTDFRHLNRRMLESLILAGAFDGLGYTRKTLLEHLDTSMRHGQRHQEDRKNGQTSMFDLLEAGSGQTEPIPRGRDITEFNQELMLQYEKEVLGFYFSGHPLAVFQKTLRSTSVTRIEELDRIHNRQKIELAGVISGISIRLTRTRKEMGRFTIEDMTGRMECTLFPSGLEKNRSQLVEDRPVLVQGTLEKSDETGTPALIVDSVRLLTLESLEEKLEQSVHLKLNASSMDPVVVRQLQSILRAYSGPLTVFFHLVPDGKSNGGEIAPEGGILPDYKVIRAHESFSVDLNQELVGRLKRLAAISGIYLSVGDQYRVLR